MRKIIPVFSAGVATATSNPITVLNADRVTLVCKRAGHAAGNTVFTAEVGVGTDYAAYNKWISNATNTNVQGETRVASLTLNSNSVGFLTMSPEDIFEFIKITATRNTDGNHSVWLIIDYK